MLRSRKIVARVQRGRLPYPFHETFYRHFISHWNLEISNMGPTEMKNQHYTINLHIVPFQGIPKFPCSPCQISHDHCPLNLHNGQFKDIPRSRKIFSRAQRGRLPYPFHQTFDIHFISHEFGTNRHEEKALPNKFPHCPFQGMPKFPRSPCAK